MAWSRYFFPSVTRVGSSKARLVCSWIQTAPQHEAAVRFHFASLGNRLQAMQTSIPGKLSEGQLPPDIAAQRMKVPHGQGRYQESLGGFQYGEML
jgi:hypothetical protein